MSNLDHIRSYYAALNTGDADRVAEHFTDDAIHYYTRLGPCIEWTMTYRDPRSGERRLDRGTEWFRFRDGRIAEVRAYHHGGPKNPSGDLLGFNHAGRGYTTLNDYAGGPERALTARVVQASLVPLSWIAREMRSREDQAPRRMSPGARR